MELALPDRLRDPRIVIRRDDLEPTSCLGGVAADVCALLLDPGGVRGEKRREVRGGLAPRPRWPSVPASGLPSTAITRSPRCVANVCPTSRHVLVLPTPPLREMKAILRHPATGVLTLATSSLRRSSSGLGPIATRPWESGEHHATPPARRDVWAGSDHALGGELAGSTVDLSRTVLIECGRGPVSVG